MQNKPNSLKPKINATSCTPCHSDRRHASSVPKRRNLLQYSRRLPNRLFDPLYQEIMPCIMQNKPNFPNAKTNATPFAANVYENKRPLPNSKKQTQSNPIPPTQYATKAPCGAIRNTQYEKQTQSSPIPCPQRGRRALPRNSHPVYITRAR